MMIAKPRQPRSIKTMNQEIIPAKLCTVFTLLALLIACVGLYGTTAYTVARRTGEIGSGWRSARRNLSNLFFPM